MAAIHPLLSRRPHHGGPAVGLLASAPDLSFVQARVHEACGPARQTLALWLCARTSGPIVWIAPSWSRDTLHADGIQDWVDPSRLILIHPRRAEDILWGVEEVLRSGAVALVVADLPGLPSLTQVRRMHLAAQTGAQEGQISPLGVLLTPEKGGAQGVETRWHMRPDHGPEGSAWLLDRLRARTAPQKSWRVTGAAQSNTLQAQAASALSA